ncbi:hypothetical protein BDD12DRAFT_815178 [Trichophaea hybrida]|nr:hypothetical protein BDD12DRAFT_815178 [Trichophaea hybrida]
MARDISSRHPIYLVGSGYGSGLAQALKYSWLYIDIYRISVYSFHLIFLSLIPFILPLPSRCSLLFLCFPAIHILCILSFNGSDLRFLRLCKGSGRGRCKRERSVVMIFFSPDTLS